MKTISRKDITNSDAREILDIETHHDHEIVQDEDGRLFWKTDKKVRERVDKAGLNNIIELFDSLGMDWNCELVRKMYRGMGYSLFGYWEVFYCEANNGLADKYIPNEK